MSNEGKKWAVIEFYKKYQRYCPADVWAYIIMIIIVGLAAIFIL
jgi:hypothetical protein